MAGRATTHANPGGAVATRLRLSAPGRPEPQQLETAWHAVVETPTGDIAPEVAARAVKPHPVAGRGERALLAAVARNDVDVLRRIAAQSGSVQVAAQVLLGLRLLGEDPAAAAQALTSALAGAPEPGRERSLRRYLPTLAAEVQLAPGVPAIMGLGRETIALLVVDAHTRLGQGADGLSTLTELPQTAPVLLARAAAHVAAGQHGAAVIVTDPVSNIDDLTALALVARSVALRSLGRAPEAVIAVTEALRDPARHVGVLAAALEERAYVYRLVGDTAAAKVDMEQLAEMAGGLDGIVPPEPVLQVPPVEDVDDEVLLTRARARLRRRISAAGEPGTFGGRHHRTYCDEIAAMLGTGRIDTSEELLLGLIDAVQDEADDRSIPIDPTFFLTLADLYDDQDRPAELQALRERYAEAAERHGVADPDEDPGAATLADEWAARRKPVDRAWNSPAGESTTGPLRSADSAPLRPVAALAVSGDRPVGSDDREPGPVGDHSHRPGATEPDENAAASLPTSSGDLDQVRRLRARRAHGLRGL